MNVRTRQERRGPSERINEEKVNIRKKKSSAYIIKKLQEKSKKWHKGKARKQRMPGGAVWTRLGPF